MYGILHLKTYCNGLWKIYTAHLETEELTDKPNVNNMPLTNKNTPAAESNET